MTPHEIETTEEATAFQAFLTAVAGAVPESYRQAMTRTASDELSILRGIAEMAWVTGREYQRSQDQAALDCQEGHVCANHPIHAQAKIIKQRMDLEVATAIVEAARAYQRAVEEWRFSGDNVKHRVAEEALFALLDGAPEGSGR